MAARSEPHGSACRPGLSFLQDANPNRRTWLEDGSNPTCKSTCGSEPSRSIESHDERQGVQDPTCHRKHRDADMRSILRDHCLRAQCYNRGRHRRHGVPVTLGFSMAGGAGLAPARRGILPQSRITRALAIGAGLREDLRLSDSRSAVRRKLYEHHRRAISSPVSSSAITGIPSGTGPVRLSS
ncbi:hypothetical protein BDP55DRAFT_629915 [Colletotrichum godetiae]|uniref:Uncharacterized protein n=1 Tax=Colletotrichum godetiae TaxID=1209918 RepID=A0AAJ0F0B9_9PEZI|nr:uncharacterized protein BDP55DRAFT_629915 [Colletotrichum godetiae]KAK1688317.1 hypothetical protein BDP55DRAFT_629915 [Colletotrichum godetiae]